MSRYVEIERRSDTVCDIISHPCSVPHETNLSHFADMLSRAVKLLQPWFFSQLYFKFCDLFCSYDPSNSAKLLVMNLGYGFTASLFSPSQPKCGENRHNEAPFTQGRCNPCSGAQPSPCIQHINKHYAEKRSSEIITQLEAKPYPENKSRLLITTVTSNTSILPVFGMFMSASGLSIRVLHLQNLNPKQLCKSKYIWF